MSKILFINLDLDLCNTVEEYSERILAAEKEIKKLKSLGYVVYGFLPSNSFGSAVDLCKFFEINGFTPTCGSRSRFENVLLTALKQPSFPAESIIQGYYVDINDESFRLSSFLFRKGSSKTAYGQLDPENGIKKVKATNRWGLIKFLFADQGPNLPTPVGFYTLEPAASTYTQLHHALASVETLPQRFFNSVSSMFDALPNHVSKTKSAMFNALPHNFLNSASELVNDISFALSSRLEEKTEEFNIVAREVAISLLTRFSFLAHRVSDINMEAPANKTNDAKNVLR